ncbi:hypothetical protein [Bacillus kexueae]|uniref:hypothetical protein n=1 Tax=Aeribacillus kexueae TaxID=2078952 RepID=UPI001FAF77AE|nr:hypothetical protein [Bacillus kexueae]
MKNGFLYTFYLVIIGIVSFITGEIVTFVMLGLILVSLQNIHSTLKELVETQKQNRQD